LLHNSDKAEKVALAFDQLFASMGVGRIFSGEGPVVDFLGVTKNIFPGGMKVVAFHFTYSKPRKQTFC